MGVGTKEKQRGVEIEEEKDDPFVCYGYCRNRPWTWLSYAMCVLTAGLAVLVFYWKPDWWIRITCDACDLRSADEVIIKDSFQRFHVCRIKNIEITSECVCPPHILKDLLRRHVLVNGALRFFKYQKMRYIWDPNQATFFKLRVLDGEKDSSEFYNKLQNGLSEQEADTRRFLYGLNKIHIQVRPIIVLLVQEVLNPFYIFQIFSVSVWMADEYYYYSACIILLSSISITLSLYTTRKECVTLRNMVESSVTVEVLRKSGACVNIPEDQLVPGDVITLPSHGCFMTCDAVLLAGNCIVNESMLTGESVPVTKTPLPVAKSTEGHGSSGYSSDKKHKRHTLFCGTHVIQTRYYGGEMVKAVVVRTGFGTAKGNLVRSILYPKPMDFSILKDVMVFIGILAAFAAMGFIYTIFNFVSFGYEASYIIKRSLDVITIAVPPALPASLTIGMVYAQLRLKAKGIFCISPQRINTCGSLNVICFDKTGTLTEDGLDMNGVQLAENGVFTALKSSVTELPTGHHTAAMATCHSLTIINGELRGDPIDLKMFQDTRWELEEPSSQESTNFDQLVPTIVRPPAKSAKIQNDDREIGILKQFPFSSDLQRMSVITRTLGDQSMQLYVKGSPEMIASLSQVTTVPSDFQEQLNAHTEKGFRVLALATRQLDKSLSWHKTQLINRGQVEKDLVFLGLLVMENQLKPATAPVVKELKAANIRTVMVTGDNILTAINIARKCGMVGVCDEIVRVDTTSREEGRTRLQLTRLARSQNMNGSECHNQSGQRNRNEVCLPIEPAERQVHYAMEGKAFSTIREHFPDEMLQLAAQGTIFARMTPDQKAQLVQVLQGLQYRVGMCGDGANDCGALKAAHAGVALSETEASVASPFTSQVQNISCIPALIKEGRAALVTSFGMFKFIALYSMIQYITVIIGYSYQSNMSDFMFMYADIFICTSVILFMGRNGAYHTIAAEKPAAKLVVAPILFSLVFQVVIQAACQATIFGLVQTQPWFVPLEPISNERNPLCWETTSVFYVAMFQTVIVAVVYTPGEPYRKAFYTNYLYLADIVIIITCNLALLFYPPQQILDLFELKHIPSYRFKGVILGMVLLNLVLSSIVELVIVPSRTLMGLLSCKACRRPTLLPYEQLAAKQITDVEVKT